MMSILLQGMGLQYISASLSMMLSGSCVISGEFFLCWVKDPLFLLVSLLQTLHTS